MIIIHGDSVIQSRKKLVELIDSAKLKNLPIKRLESKNLELKTLELELNSTSLFGSQQLVILEGLHSLPTSKRKKDLISYLINRSLQLGELVLYETRQLTANMLKKFPGAQIFEFKTSNKLFKFLDTLGQDQLAGGKETQIQLLQTVLEADGDFMVFAMLIRQIRLLIQAKDGGVIKGPPFMIGKLKSQASRFTLKQLLIIHEQLFEIDLKQKTSQGLLPLGSELELLVINM
jgi:DNA polymerase III delta subunit